MKNQFIIKDNFWSRYQSIVSDIMLPYQYNVLNDSVNDPDIAKSHSFENFRIAAGESKGEFYGCVFQDSDTAKWLEAVAYSLMLKPNKDLEQKADEIISLIGRAQQPDGYMNTYFIVKQPNDKWSNLMEGHEMYCAGHFMEAAAAYYEATGKDELLNIVRKNADLIYKLFGNNKREGIPGHPEIELALVRLYKITGDKKYLELSKQFIDQRGTNPNFFKEESKKRGWHLWNFLNENNTDYMQNSHPVRKEKNAVGHAVRAVYLYTGMALAAKETKDQNLVDACERMWSSIVNKRMYITGGIGSSAPAGEAFTMDYDLPNDTAYNETCASIGLIFFAKAMAEITNNAKYFDTAELALYNTVLAGIQCDGTHFFYTNPLEVDPMYAKKIPELNHVFARRPKWHGCACCPPNAARLIASLNRYAWHSNNNVLYSDLFIGGEYHPYEGTTVTTKTSYPYDSLISYTIKSAQELSLAIRKPAWSKKLNISVNNVHYSYSENNGYAIIEHLNNGDTVTVNIDITPHAVYSNTKVHSNDGKCSFMAGPIVYCFEDCDNGDINNFYANTAGNITVNKLNHDIIGNINTLTIPAYKLEPTEHLYSFNHPKSTDSVLTAVPYYTWGNRAGGKMKVWITAK